MRFPEKTIFVLVVLLLVGSSIGEAARNLHSQDWGNYRQNDRGRGSGGGGRWVYGLGLGLYQANHGTANYYNGSGPDHNLERTLNLHYNRDRLIRDIDEIIASFAVYELANDMRYRPALQVGFYGGLELSRSFALLAEANYARLQALGRFTLETDKETFTSEPYLLLCDISGAEERIDLRLGAQYTLHTPSYIHPFVESGVSITDTKVLSNRVSVKGININIRNAFDEYYNIRDYGMGMGFYTTLGLKMEVNEQFAVRSGVSVNYIRINLGDNTRMDPQFTFFLRMDLSSVLSPSAP